MVRTMMPIRTITVLDMIMQDIRILETTLLNCMQAKVPMNTIMNTTNMHTGRHMTTVR